MVLRSSRSGCNGRSCGRHRTSHGSLEWGINDRESLVFFRVEQVIKGTDAPATLTLSGYLSKRNDFNELPVPYHSGRNGGRSGGCVANNYKVGEQYLLVLKREKEKFTTDFYSPGAANGPQQVGYTADWYALGPTSEQLSSADDPWLRWVVETVATRRRQVASPVVTNLAKPISRAVRPTPNNLVRI
jgi:hypothetical protein